MNYVDEYEVDIKRLASIINITENKKLIRKLKKLQDTYEKYTGYAAQSRDLYGCYCRASDHYNKVYNKVYDQFMRRGTITEKRRDRALKLAENFIDACIHSNALYAKYSKLPPKVEKYQNLVEKMISELWEEIDKP